MNNMVRLLMMAVMVLAVKILLPAARQCLLLVIGPVLLQFLRLATNIVVLPVKSGLPLDMLFARCFLSAVPL